ncbi:MAG TPA: ribonuclease R [Flavobacteriales bacterium]|nr:ribonuclease R [Flavobacteriales bacterium]
MVKRKDQAGNSDKRLIPKIIKVFNKYPKKSFNHKQISKRIGVNTSFDKKATAAILQELVKKSIIKEIDRGKFKLKEKAIKETNVLIEGTVDMTTRGAAFIISKDSKTDIYIAPKNTLNALHNDLVSVSVIKRTTNKHRRGGSEKINGRIIKIIERHKTNFVGRLEVQKDFAFLIIDNPKIHIDLFIPINKLNGGKNGMKAIGKITDWPKSTANPFGEIIEVLGVPGDNDTEINAILSELDLPSSFPEHIAKLADKIPIKISDEEISRRRDFRKVTTFTIDPKDAKDFDDALSIEKNRAGNWEIGVHIADVSHYVQPGSEIDKEAFDRGTSIYLVDRVIPMLPEKLSNLICSLRPNEEKLCFSAVFEMTEKGGIINEWFGRTIICSDQRFTYSEAQELIEGKHKNKKFETQIMLLNKIAVRMRKNRFLEGAIGFERIEVKFDLDEKGNPLRVIPKEVMDSNRLIEEFMLLANRRVAEFIGKTGNNASKKQVRPFVYRVHDTPDAEKLKQFNMFLKTFGYELRLGTPKDIAFSINKLLNEVKGKPEQNVIETIAIRTMSKAIYTSANIGHYGLGFKYYSHFTSPIRRYPDLLVHRLFAIYLADEKPNVMMTNQLEEYCKHCSNQEKKAVHAERDSVKFKQVQFMQDKIGKEYNGIISGVTEFGLFVELTDNKCEGLVRISDLDDDHYFYDQDNYCLKGKRYHQKYTLGDPVSVLINSVDLLKKQLNLVLIN